MVINLVQPALFLLHGLGMMDMHTITQPSGLSFYKYHCMSASSIFLVLNFGAESSNILS